MAKYCDSKVLEKNWFNWIISRESPELEPFRERGILWTRIMGYAKNGNNIIFKNNNPLPDPSYPLRSHCIPFVHPVYFTTFKGLLQQYCVIVKSGKRIISESKDIFNMFDELDIDVDEEELLSFKYFKELPERDSWHSLLIDINSISHGVANKFRQPNEEEKTDLAHEVIMQIVNKLLNHKLVYVQVKHRFLI
jgi:hypothetical protein